MLAHPRMVGRGLDCEIERHLHPERCGGTDESPKVREGAELGVDCPMTAFFRTDGVRAPWIPRLRNRAVVSAFAVNATDRMDRNEIDDVEAEPRDFREARDTIIKRGTFAALQPLAPWKHFVPCG